MSARHRSSAPIRKYVSQEDAAELLGVHVRTVRRMIASGDLAGYRLGGRIIRVSFDDVEKLLRPIPTVGAAAC